jgi:hypothetical protein
MKRMTAILAVVCLLAAGAVMPAAHADDATVREAFIWGFPAQQMDSVAAKIAHQHASHGAATLNTWAHVRKLSTAADRFVTTPNSDTLYSTALLDLSRGPVTLSIPDLHGRYYSIALLDMYSNNAAIIGSRNYGTRARKLVLVGPDSHAPLPANSQVLQLPQHRIVVLMRILVQDKTDVAAVSALQDQFQLTPMASGSTKPVQADFAGMPGEAADPAAFLAAVNRVIEGSPPPAYEAALLARFAKVGICGASCGWDRLPEEVRESWRTQYATLQASVRGRGMGNAADHRGWSAPKATLGDFGTDYMYRAQIARQGLLALPPVEAIYYSTATDAGGQALDGTHQYKLSIPAAGLPVNAFWSLTLYETVKDGRLFFHDNPLNRYLINDRMPSLRKNESGETLITIGNRQPAVAENWLPAPPGHFVLVLRAYGPKTELLDGSHAIPKLERQP